MSPIRSLAFTTTLAASLSLGLVGCGDDERPDFDGPGGGGIVDDDAGGVFDGQVNIDVGTGGFGSGDGGCGPNLKGLLRDFKADQKDFERPGEGFYGIDEGIVQEALGADQKPVYAGPTKSTSGKAEFDRWYRDNTKTKEFSIPFMRQANGVFSFTSNSFFPFDNEGYGNEGRGHNFHFTFEFHTEFLFGGGETFTFDGDDDLFVFINRKLAIDIGGVHGKETKSIQLDTANAAKFGLTNGETYPFDIFHAERHTTESNFKVETTFKFVNCGVIVQ